MSTITKPEVLYHYTTGTLFSRILKKGFIDVDRSEPDNEKEIPSAIFSSNPVWERSRYRVGKLADGQLVMLNKVLLKQFDRGLYRIAVPSSVTDLDWKSMKNELHMSYPTIQAIYDFAIQVGAKTSEWFATRQPVSEDVWIQVEKLNANDEWVELEEDDIPVASEDDSPVVNLAFPTVGVNTESDACVLDYQIQQNLFDADWSSSIPSGATSL